MPAEEFFRRRPLKTPLKQRIVRKSHNGGYIGCMRRTAKKPANHATLMHKNSPNALKAPLAMTPTPFHDFMLGK